MSLELGGPDPRILFSDGTAQATSALDAEGNPIDPRVLVNETANRSINTTYPNNTGMEMIVRVRVNTTAVNGNVSINFTDGFFGDFAMNPLNAAPAMVTLAVPPGRAYTVGFTNASISQWSEFKKVAP